MQMKINIVACVRSCINCLLLYALLQLNFEDENLQEKISTNTAFNSS